MKIFIREYVELEIDGKKIASRNLTYIGDKERVEQGGFSRTYDLSKKWDAEDFKKDIGKYGLGVLLMENKRKGEWFQGHGELIAHHWFSNSKPTITVKPKEVPDMPFYELKYYPAEIVIEYLKDRGINSIGG